MIAGSIRHGNRWIRGWSRVGLVLGLITAVIVLAAGGIAVLDAYHHRDFDYEKLACLLSENSNQPLAGDQFKAKAVVSSCGFFSPYDTYSVLRWQVFGSSINKNGYLYIKTADEQKQRNAIVAAVWTMAIAIVAFAIVFLLSWTLGWVFAGFARV